MFDSPEETKKSKEKITDIFGEASEEVLDIIMDVARARVRQELPFLKKNIKKMQLKRGAALEASIVIEHAYNNFLPFFTPLTKDEVISLRFGDKTKKVKEIINEHIEEGIFKEELLNDLDEIRLMRNLFAHVPINYESEKLQFNKHDRYYIEAEDKKYKEMELEDIANSFDKKSKEFNQKIFKVIKILILKGINNPPPKLEL